MHYVEREYVQHVCYIHAEESSTYVHCTPQLFKSVFSSGKNEIQTAAWGSLPFRSLQYQSNYFQGVFNVHINWWEADIWGWLEVRRSAMIHFNERQRPHWACWQYGHTGGTRGWLGVERWQLCLRDTSRSANCHRRAAVGHWISLCVKCSRMVDSAKMAIYLYPGQYCQTICQ